ncbi:MAG TPA: hypothetical protein VFX07_00320 [Candidatus Udaeobacter sp.]|nr:hypothetical protein [Candidatus Udaeobacter sp.]
MKRSDRSAYEYLALGGYKALSNMFHWGKRGKWGDRQMVGGLSCG